MTVNESTVVGVVGAGAMGTGIAQVAAAAGHRVVLADALDGAAARAQANIAKALDREVEKKRLQKLKAFFQAHPSLSSALYPKELTTPKPRKTQEKKAKTTSRN